MVKDRKIRFLYEVSSLLECGISMKDLTQFLSPEFSREKDSISSSLSSGEMLHEIFAQLDLLDANEVELLKIAEETGDISQVFSDMHQRVKKDSELRKKLISFMIYPVFMLILMTAYTLFALFFMVPMMSDLLRSMDIKEGLLFRMDEIRLMILKNWKILLPVTGGIIIILIRWAIRSSLHLRIVLGNRYHLYRETLFISKISNLMRGGKNIVQAFSLVGESHFDTTVVEKALEEGESLWESLSRGGFSKDLTSIVRINEESGDIVRAFTVYLDKSEKEMNHTMEKRIKMLEPLTLILTGVLMSVSLLSVMGPLMDGFSKI